MSIIKDPTLEQALQTIQTPEQEVGAVGGNISTVEEFQTPDSTEKDRLLVNPTGGKEDSPEVDSNNSAGTKPTIENTPQAVSYGPPLGDTKAGDEDTSPGNIARGILREKQEGDLPKD